MTKRAALLAGCVLALGAGRGASAAPVFLSLDQALQSSAAATDGYQRYVLLRRPGYQIRIWRWVSAKVLPPSRSPSERIDEVTSGRQLILLDGEKRKHGAGSIWLYPPGGRTPASSSDPKEPATGFSIIEDPDEKAPRDAQAAKFRRIPSLLEKHRLAPEADSAAKRFHRGASVDAYLVQVAKASAGAGGGPGEHVLYVVEGRAIIRLPTISYGAGPGYLVVVPAQTPFSIVNRGDGKVVVIRYWIHGERRWRRRGA